MRAFVRRRGRSLKTWFAVAKIFPQIGRIFFRKKSLPCPRAQNFAGLRRDRVGEVSDLCRFQGGAEFRGKF
jgi:hypothetical protein